MSPVFSGVALVALSTVFDSFSQISMKKATPRNRATAAWITAAILFSCVEAVLYTFALKVLAVGIAFAIAPDKPGVAYALDMSELDAVLAVDLSRPVATGPCIG